MITFSIVIPLFNKGRYIERAVRSVLRQDFRSYELIVVDDGSTDDGPSAVRKMSDPRIRLIVQDNLGPSLARRSGVIAANGPYVAFLDADDEWDPAFLSEMLGLITSYPECGMYASAYRILEKSGRTVTVYDRFRPATWRGRIDNYFRRVANRNLIVCSSAVVVARSALSEEVFVQGRANAGEDQYAWSAVALEYEVAYSQKPLALYHREAESSFSNVGPPKKAPCFVPFLANVCRTGTFHDRAVAPGILRYVRRYVAESLVQMAVLNARAGDTATALSFLIDKRATAKPLRLAAVAAYTLLKALTRRRR